MEDVDRTRASRVLRVEQPSRVEDELWQRAYERLVPRLNQRSSRTQGPPPQPDGPVAGRVVAQGA